MTMKGEEREGWGGRSLGVCVFVCVCQNVVQATVAQSLERTQKWDRLSLVTARVPSWCWWGEGFRELVLTTTADA